MLIWTLAAGALVLAGCDRRDVNGSDGATPTTVGAKTSGLSPIENYKQARLREAMRGLLYDNLVTLDPETAPEVAREVAGRDYRDLVAEGRSNYEQSLFVEAIGSFTRAVVHSPDEFAAYEGLGDALVAKGRIEESQAAFATGLAIDGQSIAVRFKFAENLQRKGDLGMQIAALEDVLELDPAHVEAHSRLAIAHYYNNDDANAWREVRQTERLGGSVPPQFRILLAQRTQEPGE